jgi:predicted nuclease of restriction endonuclease-like (RecB) superfamily
MSDLASNEYGELLTSLKARIRAAQLRAAVSVNREMVLLYWSIGKDILERQDRAGWGARIIDQLGQDLRSAFPGMKGLSPRNLKYMRAFAEAWPDEEIMQQLVAQIPWGHNVRLLDRLSDSETRSWYAQKTIQNGWSRNVLEMQIETRLHERQGKAITNFDATLSAPQSDLARELIKDPYKFDFLGIGEEAEERAIEDALVAHIQKFLLELGVGFAFVGRQYRLEVAGDEFFIDLLFYHLRLRCFVVIELKAGKFKPEYAGKLNFYLSAVDDLLRHPSDAKSIGIILCRTKNAVIAEYALRDLTKPMGVSQYELARSLPTELKDALPSIEQLEHELTETAAEDTDE